MFSELTVNEQYEVQGGAIPALVKFGILVLEIILVAGAIKGCTNEAAK